MKKQITLLIAISFAIFSTTNVFAQVTSGADDGSPGTLRAEIAAAMGGDIITFDGVTTVTLVSELIIDKSLIITGDPATTVTIDANGTGRVFNITAGPVTLINLTLTNGLETNGGAIYMNTATVTIENCVITGNTANGNVSGGGGIFNDGGILNITSSTIIEQNIADGTDTGGRGGAIFNNTDGILNLANGLRIENNYASRAGGAIEDNSGGTLTFVAVVLDGNSAGVDIGLGNTINPNPGNGGAIHLSGSTSADISNSNIENNLAAQEGGGLWNGTGTMRVRNTLIAFNEVNGNAAHDGGGGIFNMGGTLLIEVSTSILNNIANGTSGSGGGIFSLAGNVTIDDVDIQNNTANRAGGGIEIVDGLLTMTDVLLNNNSTGSAPGNGGALHVTGTANTNISGGITSNNTAANEGGGLWNGSGVMTVVDHTISANTASGSDATVAGAAGGGGIYNEGGTLDLSGTTVISNNTATGAQSTGGGILNAAGTLTANGISITNNQSNRAGGGIETNGASSVTLIDVNLDDNITGVITGAGAPGNGGGLHVSGAAPVTITGGTVSRNVAAKEGGGLWNNQGVLTISGTRISDNDAQGDFVADPLEIVGGGGIFAEDGVGSVIINEGTTISSNFASGTQGSGGGILMATGTTLTINGTLASPVTISGNAASRAGGGIEDWSLDTNVNTLMFVSFLENTAGLDVGTFTANGGPGNGGAIHVSGPGSNTITGGSGANNKAASEGGAFWNGLGTMTFNGVNIDSNIASGDASDNGGAGIFNNGGTLNVLNGTSITNNVANGTAGSGGGILSVDGEVTVDASSIITNQANRAGGGIEMAAGNLQLTNSNLQTNNAGTAPGNGGGVHLGGAATATISTSTFRGNVAVEGGALWNSGSSMVVTTSEISGNSASEGGGVYNETGGIATVMRSTISGNTATTSGGGLTNNGASLDLNAVTVAMNTAATAGGIDAVNSVSLKNTIVALNTAGSGNDVSGTIVSNNYNLIGSDDLNVFTPLANDLEGVNPVIGPLQDNGGTTFTHQLMQSSPAFDAGDPADTFADQIGQAVFGASRDIGAYEAQANLSLDDFNQASSVLSIYPNPTRGEFKIVVADSVTGNVNVQIISVTGQLVKKLSISNGINKMEINGMTSGLYIINIQTEKGTTSHKLILE